MISSVMVDAYIQAGFAPDAAAAQRRCPSRPTLGPPQCVLAVAMSLSFSACFSEPGGVGGAAGSTSTSGGGADVDSEPNVSEASGTVSTAASSGPTTTDTTGEAVCEGRFDLPGECTDSPTGMAVVEMGTFEMGCDQLVEMGACESDEFPVHTVSLGAFAIDLVEVDIAAYEECVTNGACSSRAALDGCSSFGVGVDNHPATCVTWQQATEYCVSLGKRLPTEAEWEFAAEGSNNRRWPWGSDPNPNCDLAAVVDEGHGCGTGQALPVGSKPAGASEAGILDLVGNVSEWTSDWYGTDAYANHAAIDPGGPASGDLRVFRGGAYVHGMVATLRVRNRWSADPEATDPVVGFRCAASASE